MDSLTLADRCAMKVTGEQLKVLCAIAEAAGREVMAVYASDFESWHKDDASPLTEADLRADAVIRNGLEAAFPNVFILSEESVSTGQGAAEIFFLVDPLDGTKEFLRRNDEFTVNIALVQRGGVMAGVVFAPALGKLFYAARGIGAWVSDLHSVRRLKVAKYSEGAPLRVIGSRSHGSGALTDWLARLPYPHELVVAGSSLKFCRIAEGAADIYPRFGATSQWDTAAAQCVLEVAGGAVLDLSGERLCYGLERPVINPEFIAMSDSRLILLSSVTRR